MLSHDQCFAYVVSGIPVFELSVSLGLVQCLHVLV